MKIYTVIKCLLHLIACLLFTRIGYSQCSNTYVLNWSDPSTYTIDCGTVVPAQWTVKNDSCNYWSPPISVGGSLGGPDKTVAVTVRINQSGNLTSNNFARIFFKVNGVTTKTVVVRGDTVAAVFTHSDNITVPSAGNLVIHISLRTDHNTRFWQIKNGDIDGCVTSGVPLPIQLIYFKADPYPTATLLEWETATEFNNHYFIIEREIFGEGFTKAGIVVGAGNSTNNSYYKFYDYSNNNEETFYRLKQVDFDGNESIVAVAHFEPDRLKNQFSIFPNPSFFSKIVLTLKNAAEKDVLISISDLYHNQVFSQQLKADIQSKITLPLPTLSPGIYFIRSKVDNEIFSEKLVVN